MFKRKKHLKNRRRMSYGFDSAKAVLPPVVDKCVEFLEGKVETEGLFRVSGSVARVQTLKQAVQTEGSQFQLPPSSDTHVVAGCLKLFFRELPNPVCTYELYDCFYAATDVPFVDSRVQCVKKLLELLPPGNALILKRFVSLLHKISLKSDINKMTESNLAIVFAPTLLRREGETLEDMVQDQEVLNKLVSFFITHYEYLFEDKELPPSAATTDADHGGTMENDNDIDNDNDNDNEDISDSEEPSILYQEEPEPLKAPASVNTVETKPAQIQIQLPPPSLSAAAAASTTTSTTATSTANEEPEASSISLSRALWGCSAAARDELSFKAGDVMVLQHKGENENEGYIWAYNISDESTTGWIQSNYVCPLDKRSVVIVEALHSYRKPEPALKEVLDLQVGDVIIVTRRGKPGTWWEGDLDNRHGIFPSTHTKILWAPMLQLRRNQRARHLSMNRFFSAVSKVNLHKLAEEDISQFQTPHSANTPSAQAAKQNQSNNNTDSSNHDNQSNNNTDSSNQDNQSADPGAAPQGAEPEYVLAVYDYSAQPNTPELSFSAGNRLKVLKRFDSGWLEVEADNGSRGFAPGTYVQNA